MSLNRDLGVFSEIIERNGRAIMNKAIAQVLDADYDAGKVSTAAKHHTRFLSKVAPVFPALLNLAYESAGKGTHKPIGVGAALTLFIEAANIHDDIIDQSQIKHNRKTAYGKFGTDISILAGDILLVQGAFALYRECDKLPFEQREKIVQATFESLTEISNSAAQEALMHKRFDVSPKDYLEVVRLRAAVSETHCMVGAILGGATTETVDVLSKFGRSYGIIGTVLDEFLDCLDYEKFGNRLSKECLPLPVLCALEDIELRKKILPVIKNFQVSESDYRLIMKLVMGSNNVKKLRENQIKSAEKMALLLSKLTENDAVEDFKKLCSVFKSLACNMEEFTSRVLV